MTPRVVKSGDVSSRRKQWARTAWILTLVVATASGPGSSAQIAPARDTFPNEESSDPEPTDGDHDDDVFEATAVAAPPPRTASSVTLTGSSLRMRRILHAGEMLLGVPGMFVAQHGGGGKANQYFLRGFDADHGTDVGLFLDGVPLNLPTHGHGQGYTDLNFIIPELVDRIEVRKGPFFADVGDGVVGGAIDYRLSDELPASFLRATVGRFGTQRVVLGLAPRLERVRPLLAVELFHSDGPFEIPDDYRRYSVVGRVAHSLGGGRLTWTAQSYMGRWHASGQIPRRAVRDGSISRFGYVDPYEGGESQRHSATARYERRTSSASSFEAAAYVVRSQLVLYSDFSFFSVDQADGDMIRQVDDRVFAGVRGAYSHDARFGRASLTTRAGPQLRFDRTRPRLAHAPARTIDEPISSAAASLLALGAFAEADLRYAAWLRVVAGLRLDGLVANVDDRLDPSASGNRSAILASPKLTAIAHLGPRVHVFTSFGSGFHSNDARGFVRPAPNRVDPFARALGYELGLRAEPSDLVSIALSGYALTLASEVVFVGDEGTSEARGRTRRLGAEVDVRVNPTEWLHVDLSGTYGTARFADLPDGANAVPLAPTWMVQSGIEVEHPSGISGRVSLVVLGDRPANEDASVVAEGFARVDAVVAYSVSQITFELAVQNVTNAAYEQAQFASVTRLRGETESSSCGAGSTPVEEGGAFLGCQDLTFTPGAPTTVLGSVTTRF